METEGLGENSWQLLKELRKHHGQREPGLCYSIRAQGRKCWETRGTHISSSLPPHTYYTDSPGIRLETHTCNRNRTLSPQASPMVELFVPSREPAAESTEHRVRGSQAGRVGKTWGLGLGPGPQGARLGPTVAGMRDHSIYFGERIRKKKLRGGDGGLKWGEVRQQLGAFPWGIWGKQQG